MRHHLRSSAPWTVLCQSYRVNHLNRCLLTKIQTEAGSARRAAQRGLAGATALSLLGLISGCFSSHGLEVPGSGPLPDAGLPSPDSGTTEPMPDVDAGWDEPDAGGTTPPAPPPGVCVESVAGSLEVQGWGGRAIFDSLHVVGTGDCWGPSSLEFESVNAAGERLWASMPILMAAPFEADVLVQLRVTTESADVTGTSTVSLRVRALATLEDGPGGSEGYALDLAVFGLGGPDLTLRGEGAEGIVGTFCEWRVPPC